MAKIPRYLYYLVGAAVALVLYTVLTAPETVPTRRANNTFAGGASRKKADDTYRPEDYTAKFPPVNVAPRDAFKPLVAKTTTTLAVQPTPLAPNGIPASFAGGDGNWVYTGNAEVDGVPNALLENTASQETVFLRPGERWKSLTLAGVTASAIELIGPTGQRRSVGIADETAATTQVAATTPAGTAPGSLPAVTPNGRGALAGSLSGPIGADAGAQAAPADAGTNRRTRRNRRNNRDTTNAAGIAPVGAVQTP